MMTAYKNLGFDIADYPNAYAQYVNEVTLPLNTRLSDEDVEYMCTEYDHRRRYIVKSLREIGLRCFEPEGAFYVFPNVSGYGMTSEEFAENLIREKHVAIVPGTAFGACGEGNARISYAYSIKHITRAIELMDEFLREHR